ncbi:MAG: EAL domain-containing protein [Pseudomonadota bacterium]
MACTLVLGCLLLIENIGGPLERAVDPLRFAANRHDASGKVAIVEMDAQSAETIGQWPWPRRNYARVVDALREAGASSIVFDVDLSAASTPQDDQLLAQSLARSDGLVALPTFGQRASSTESRSIDALPLAMLRNHVSLASVSVAPDQDGLVREMPFATMTEGTPRPSLSAFIAAQAGRADSTFPIDFSINPESIPRASFVAVRDGRFDPALVRGRNVLIGATAIEMGDRYATPARGILPGVVIQALAAETLIAGVPVTGWPMAVVLLALAFATVLVACRSIGAMLGAAVITFVLFCTGVLVAQHGYAVHYPLAVGIAMLANSTAMCVARDVLLRFRTQRLVDDATGLPNRRAFVAGLVPPKATVALYQINNLDRISAVLGGEHVDQVVARVADRLKLSSADGQVYRVRGQHLAFYLDRDHQPEDSMAGLRSMLLQPVEVAGRKVDVSGTIGLADDGAGIEALTDAALAAEEASQNGVFWRRRTANIDTIERSITLMGELDLALEARELLVFYQPKLSLAHDKVTSVEALVRWPHPERGFISPDEFIGLAEQTDRIEGLTLYVLDKLLADVSHWRSRGHNIRAAINISARLIASAAFNAAVERRLTDCPIPVEALIFEVTESATLSDPAAAIAALTHYRDLGVSVSLDDYGTGQSTLTYLRQLPIDELKIDKSFIQNIHRRDDDRVLVASTIELAHKLGVKVVAEGVEDAECIALLRELRCDFAQGYYISRPIPAADLLQFIDQRQKNVAA